MKRTVPVAKFEEIIILITGQAGEQYSTRQLFQDYNQLSALVDDQYKPDQIEDILRLDLETGKSISLADDVAKAWIKNHESNLTPESDVPVFVEKSDEWEEFISDWNDEAASDARYGSYVQQHRLTLSQLL